MEYRECGITSCLISKEYPFECLQEMSFPGHGCQVGSLGRNYSVVRLMYGAAGQEAGDVIVNASANVKIFKCIIGSESNHNHGYWRVEHSYGSISKPGFVTSTFNCECLKSSANFNISWKDVVGMKYETLHMGGCAVAWFFGRCLNYWPLSVVAEPVVIHTDGIVRLNYHKCSEDGPKQTLELRLLYEDGGWHISDPLVYNSPIQMKSCRKCLFSNANLGGYRMMFGLDCKKHALCEKCIFRYFAAKGRTLGDYETEHDPAFCESCNVCMRQVVHVAFDSVSQLRAPWPIAFFGQKAIFNEPFFKCMTPFFKCHLEWIMDATIQAREEILTLKRVIAREELFVEDEEEKSQVSVFLLQEKVKLIAEWQEALDAWNLVLIWLEFRVEHYRFLVEFDTPFSKAFLDQDADYFVRHLNRRKFNMLKNRAVCLTEVAKSHADAL